VSLVVLILRTVAIWHGNKRVVIFLAMLETGFAISALYAASKFLETFIHPVYENLSPALARYISKLPVCDLPTSGDHIVTFYILLMVFEAVILLFTLVKASAYRAEPSKLFRTLYYDSIVFAIFLLILSTINVVIGLTAPRPGRTTIILGFLHRNIHSILSGRIILDIRRAVYRATASELPTVSTIIFGENLQAQISDRSRYTETDSQIIGETPFTIDSFGPPLNLNAVTWTQD